MKCKLCKTNDLDNVGSHILTESIIRTALNQEGYTKREDKEIIFEISLDKVGLDYFGSAVQPEVIEDIIGKSISEELITANDNSLIDRALLCRECEKYFSFIESDFVEKVYSNIVRKAQNELLKDSCNFIEYNGLRALSLVFVLINIWRVSATTNEEWKLTEGEEENIRSYLHNIKGKDAQEILAKAKEHLEEIKSFRFIISYFIQEAENLTENGVVIDPCVNPYFFLLNRLSIIFIFQEITEKKLPKILPESIKNSLGCIIEHNDVENIRININSDSERKELFNNYAHDLTDQIMQKLNSSFIQAHRMFLGFNPTQLSANYYATEMKKYVEERNGKIEISEMLKLLAEIIYKIRQSYF